MRSSLKVSLVSFAMACLYGCASAPPRNRADSKPDSKLAMKPSTTSDAKPVAKPVAKPDHGPDTVTAAKPAIKPATKPATKLAARSRKLAPIVAATKPGADAEPGFAELGSARMKSKYWKEWPQFHMYADETGPRYTIKRFGPVGLGMDFLQPAFTMRIISIEPGSPAAATGKLRKGQYIESINGKTIKDYDPRVILGNIITEAEAKDGKLKMMIKNDRNSRAYEVVVKIPVLGKYSDTWPLECEKSERIVRDFADFLARTGKDGYGAALFLLSTGEEKDLKVVEGWYKNKFPAKPGGYPWDIGYKGPAVCEYYLRTGDKSVLPGIKSMADYLKERIYNGSWMGRGGCSYKYMAGGHMNAAGVHSATFLLLAKECGVDVDEHTMQSSLEHFYRYVGHGNVAYGDGTPEGGFVDNGRTGGLAFTMAAAAALTPEGEDSVYAKARDICATKSFYSTSWLGHGHTGGGVGEIWRGAAMGLMYEKRAEQYRSFMNERRWMYELSRTHDGAFGIEKGSWNPGYDKTGHRGGRSWGNMMALIYTVPRKKLRIYGAPPTEFSKLYQLPKRPWGNEADEAFYSLTPGVYRDGRAQDLDRELLPTDASWPIMRRIGDPKASDAVLIMYAHHIDQGIRAAAVRQINRSGKDHLIVELLKASDPRGRHSGAHAIAGQFKGRSLPANRLTDEMVDLLTDMVNDPDESWWGAYEAMNALRLARKEQIAPHADRLAYWLKHGDWWLRKAAMTALTPIATDARFDRDILPIIGRMISTNERAVALGSVRNIVSNLSSADPKVQKHAVKVLGQAYTEFPAKLVAPGGQNMSAATGYLLDKIAKYLAEAPGGFDELYRVSRKRFPNQSLPHQDIYLKADASKFGPEVMKAFRPILIAKLVPEHIGKNRAKIFDQLKKRMPGREIDGLVALLRKGGSNEYDWQLWGPSRHEIKWQYHSFDTKDNKLWEDGKRHRKVAWPKGMENWFSPDFDAKAAGWKTGYAPFAHNDGKLSTLGKCKGNFCGCGEEPKTFWEKEVLLMRAEITLPPPRDGYAYRLLVGGRSHVNWGDGSDVWFDGQYKVGRRGGPSLTGVGKRAGGKPWGFVIDDSFRKHFKDGKVLLACTGFLRWGKRSRTKFNYQTFWFEEMKLPVITQDDIVRSASAVPMLSTAYYAEKKDEDKFRWDGEFARDADFIGSWKLVAQVAAADDFAPGKKTNTRRSRWKALTLKNGGMTGNAMLIWSGDTLMDLKANAALKMTTRSIDGTDYLFVEAGGFSGKTQKGWKPPLCVMKK